MDCFPNLPLFPTPGAPMMAILTSESEDFFRRIPRIPAPELIFFAIKRTSSSAVAKPRIPINVLGRKGLLLLTGHVLVHNLLPLVKPLTVQSGANLQTESKEPETDLGTPVRGQEGPLSRMSLHRGHRLAQIHDSVMDDHGSIAASRNDKITLVLILLFLVDPLFLSMLSKLSPQFEKGKARKGN